METKFTKGNWYVKSEIDEEYPQKTNYSVHCDPFNDGKFTFTPIIADMRFARSNEEAEANAKLIAAAPELLAALQKAVNYVAYPKDEKYYGWVTDAEQAIKKATE
jgi:hypothetical protein